MKFLNSDQLNGLPVFNRNGDFLGKIKSFEIDADSQSIINYQIKSQQKIKGLFKGNLVVRRNQVLAIDEEKMIVEDNVLKESDAAKFKQERGREPIAKKVGVIQSKITAEKQ